MSRRMRIERSDRYEQLAVALDELLPRIRSHEDFRAARAVLAEMRALRPPPPREPSPDAPLWVGRQILCEIANDVRAFLTIQQNADRSFHARYAVFCKSHFSCSETFPPRYGSAAEALDRAYAQLLDALRKLHKYSYLGDLLALMTAEVESVHLRPVTIQGRPVA